PLRSETGAPLAFSLSQVELGQVCLMGTQERLCASGRLDDGDWSAAFTANDLPLSTFTAGLSENFTYEGTIDVRSEFSGSPGMLPIGSFEGQLMGARLRHRIGNDREEIMSLGN